MGLTAKVAMWATALLGSMGYPGLVLLMALESMIAPIPSEAVMPFAGFLVAQGQFTLAGAIVASSLGTLLGSWAGYLMGAWGGYPLVRRFGRYLLLNQEHLDSTVSYFERRGELTILLCRFIPVVRHFISIPAGVARMSGWRFSLYTLLGGTAWNTILLFAGIKLRERWSELLHYAHEIDLVVAALLLALLVYWLYKHRRRQSL